MDESKPLSVGAKPQRGCSFRRVPCDPTLPDASAGDGQGLTLVHFSAQRKHILWDTSGA